MNHFLSIIFGFFFGGMIGSLLVKIFILIKDKIQKDRNLFDN